MKKLIITMEKQWKEITSIEDRKLLDYYAKRGQVTTRLYASI